MEIKIPFKTPTLNHLYWHRGNIKILKTEARELRKKIIKMCEKIEHELGEGLLKVEVAIHESWYFKNGAPRKTDIANREKFLIDSVFKGLGIDDCLIWENHMYKIDSKEEFAVVAINEL